MEGILSSRYILSFYPAFTNQATKPIKLYSHVSIVGYCKNKNCLTASDAAYRSTLAITFPAYSCQGIATSFATKVHFHRACLQVSVGGIPKMYIGTDSVSWDTVPNFRA